MNFYLEDFQNAVLPTLQNIFLYIFLHFSGCGRLYCGLCPEPAMSHDQLVQTLVSELFPRGLIYRPSFSSDCLEADIQEIRGKYCPIFTTLSIFVQFNPD